MGIGSEVKNKAVFLDRDGVINKAVVIDGKPYPPASLDELKILSGVREGIALLKKNGFKIFGYYRILAGIVILFVHFFVQKLTII